MPSVPINANRTDASFFGRIYRSLLELNKIQLKTNKFREFRWHISERKVSLNTIDP
jgi:hypothetical protein